MWSVSLLTLVLLATVSVNDGFLSNAVKKGKIEEIVKDYVAKDMRYAYYTQWRDHFNLTDFSTFEQRIYINDVHYNLFGPVFIFISAQLTEYAYWLENSFISQINEEQFGVVYGMVPRFYGENRLTDDLSVESLRLLSVEQTLADIADFTRFLRLELRNNKFILYGYGDGAALATLAHQTYPGLFDGVWASGAPTDIQMNFVGYFADFQDTLLNYNRSCASIIGGGSEELDALVVAGDIDRIHELFGFQNSINLDNSKDISLIFYTIFSSLANDLEYGTQSTLTDLCNDLLESYSQGLSAVEILARKVRSFTEYLNPSWNDNVAFLSQISWYAPVAENGQRQSWYIACTERSFFRTSTSLPEPVRSRFLLNIFLDICYEAYGITQSDVALGNLESNAKYSLSSNLQNVFFTYGGMDPYRLVGQTIDLNPTSPAAVIPGFGKVFELLGYLPVDYLTPEMIAVRSRVRSHIVSVIQG